MMSLPTPPKAYSAADQAQTRSQIVKQFSILEPAATATATGFLRLGTGTVGTVGADYVTLTGANGTISTGNGYFVGPTQVVGPRATGWTAGSGTANLGAFATYAGQTWGASYSQTLAQTADNAIVAAHQRILALEQALRTHGLIGI